MYLQPPSKHKIYIMTYNFYLANCSKFLKNLQKCSIDKFNKQYIFYRNKCQVMIYDGIMIDLSWLLQCILFYAWWYMVCRNCNCSYLDRYYKNQVIKGNEQQSHSKSAKSNMDHFENVFTFLNKVWTTLKFKKMCYVFCVFPIFNLGCFC